jgi:hypothetical protein
MDLSAITWNFSNKGRILSTFLFYTPFPSGGIAGNGVAVTKSALWIYSSHEDNGVYYFAASVLFTWRLPPGADVSIG